jgi:Ca2+-binding RTX toxin-like protein
MPTIYGTSGNDTLTGTTGDDTFDLSQGGVDTAYGLEGNDTFYFGNQFLPWDTVDGGPGYDILQIGGTSLGPLYPTPLNITNIEEVDVLPGYSTTFSLPAASVPGGASLKVDATQLGVSDHLQVDGSQVAGTLTIFGGAGSDTLVGGEAVNVFNGGGGNDTITDRGAGSSIDGGSGDNRLILDRSASASDITFSFTSGALSALSDGTTIQNIQLLELMTGSGNDNVTFHGVTYSTNWLEGESWDGGGGYNTATIDLSGETRPVGANSSSVYIGGQEYLQLYNVQSVNVTGGSGDDELSGGSGNSTLVGGAGNDSLTGLGGADVLDGGAGNDMLNGGLGLDTAVYSGNRSAYTVTRNADQSYTVSGPDGTDTLTGIERLQFADQTIAIGTRTPGDFGGTGTSGIVWKSTATGQYSIWQMNGTAVGSGGFTSVQPGPEWTIIGGGDFNGDGKADILWKNTTTNQKAVWFMNGTTVAGGGFTSIQAGSEWSILGTGDFNDDGKTDLLWKNATTGQLAVWTMDGTNVTGGGFTSMQAGAEWTVLGTGDFNGDGKADILWKNTNTGQMAVWFMDGTTVTGGGFTSSQAGSEWTVLGTGDFDGDGKTDILWKNTNTGQMAVWLMNGTTVAGGGFTSAQAGSDWSLTGIGDYNGDGNADILWRNTNTGAPAIWFMNGTNVLAGSGFAGSNPGTGWNIITGAAG